MLTAGGCAQETKYPLTVNSDLQLRLVNEAAPDSVQPADLGEVLIDQTDVEYIYIFEAEEFGNIPNRFGLAFALKPEATERFAETTRAHIGRRLAMLSRGEVLNTAEIREEIHTDAVVSAHLDRKTARAQLAKIVNDHGL